MDLLAKLVSRIQKTNMMTRTKKTAQVCTGSGAQPLNIETKAVAICAFLDVSFHHVTVLQVLFLTCVMKIEVQPRILPTTMLHAYIMI